MSRAPYKLRAEAAVAPREKRAPKVAPTVRETAPAEPPKSATKPEPHREPVPSAPPRKGGDVRDGADVIQFRPRPVPDALVIEGIQLGERMNRAQREAMIAAWQTRWPEAFGGNALEGTK